jgi:8-oxo-dGTP diphosphatase
MSISEHPATIVVDVANVMGARPDGWWRDRAGAAVRLHAEIAALAASGRTILPGETSETSETSETRGTRETAGAARPEFVMVLEGAANAAGPRIAAGAPADRVRVVHAPGHGDDTIMAVVRDLPGRRIVVTADRELRDRCTAAGAEVRSPGWLLGLLKA